MWHQDILDKKIFVYSNDWLSWWCYLQSCCQLRLLFMWSYFLEFVKTIFGYYCNLNMNCHIQLCCLNDQKCYIPIQLRLLVILALTVLLNTISFENLLSVHFKRQNWLVELRQHKWNQIEIYLKMQAHCKQQNWHMCEKTKLNILRQSI